MILFPHGTVGQKDEIIGATTKGTKFHEGRVARSYFPWYAQKMKKGRRIGGL